MNVTSEMNFQGALLDATRTGQFVKERVTINTNHMAPLWRNTLVLLQALRDRLLKVLTRPKSATRMQLVERVTLAPRHQLVLVEIDGQRCLLTLAPNAAIGFHALGERRVEGSELPENHCG